MADIVTVAGFSEPLRSYNFEVIFPDTEAGFEFKVKNVELPSFLKIDTEALKVAPGFEIALPSKFEREKLVIEFWEDEDFSVFSYFKDWFSRIVNLDPDDPYYMNYNLRKNYVKDFFINLLAVDEQVVAEVRVINAYPVSVDSLKLDYGSNEIVSIRVEFEYERIEFEKQDIRKQDATAPTQEQVNYTEGYETIEG